MITLEAIKKLKRFLQNTRPRTQIAESRPQIFNSPSRTGDYRTRVYDEDGIVVLYSFYWNYFEVYGLSQEQYKDLIEGDSCRMRHFTDAELL